MFPLYNSCYIHCHSGHLNCNFCVPSFFITEHFSKLTRLRMHCILYFTSITKQFRIAYFMPNILLDIFIIHQYYNSTKVQYFRHFIAESQGKHCPDRQVNQFHKILCPCSQPLFRLIKLFIQCTCIWAVLPITHACNSI